jgi:hypothetical protein
MPMASSKAQLEIFFEEVWQLAELVAATEDRHLVPHLLALAEDIAEWRNELVGEPPALPAAAADSPLIDCSQGAEENADGAHPPIGPLRIRNGSLPK